MSTPDVIQHSGEGGYFRIFFTPPGGKRTDVTFFRGAPTRIISMSTTDPFGDASSSIEFPQITGFDRPGSGDLYWLVPWANVDIQHYFADGTMSDWCWEGMVVSEDPSEEGLAVACQGALYQLDNFRAAPWFPQYPIPYELLIKHTMDPANNPTLRTAPLQIEFPDNWNITVPTFDRPDYLWFLRPYGVKPGEKWTGLTTRNTGWDNKLTGLIQSLLSVMYTEDGQWTIIKRRGRIPVLKVRPHITKPDEDTLEIYYGAPGVRVQLSRDFTQSANVVYGSGVDLSGSTFSNQRVTPDGQHTYYEPFAALPYVHPATSDNARLNKNFIRKEVRLEFPQGMDAVAAAEMAAGHLRRFADPGYTGSITLTSDPMVSGQPRSRFLIRAGDNILVKGFRGTNLLMHVTECTVDIPGASVSLTVDSKFRDALTVAEVKARTRDALDPVHLLQVGRFSTTVQDQILPWSYSEGSGVLPSGGEYDATEFFTKRLGTNSRFPWTDFTTKFPPKKYPKYYVRVGPEAAKADLNWANLQSNGIALGIPIRMAQQGQIRLAQIAAYDEDGNVVPCRFHISIYNNSGVDSTAMPRIPSNTTPGRGKYKEGEAFPFYQGAFERINPDGTENQDPLRVLHESSGLVVGWGNYYEEAGYYPGRSSTGSPRTGLLVDESTWSFDTTSDPDFDKYSVPNTRNASTTGLLYAMIYADGHGNKPVYFLGRFWRVEPQ
jgi:hypothetical protein